MCAECALRCRASDDARLAECGRLCLDCGNLCEATAAMLSGDVAYAPDVLRAQLESCIVALAECGDECDEHGDTLDVCRACAEKCRHAEEACRSALTSMG